ncbi:MAG: hypothetical protein V2B18_24565 [Pseudomonadota bacterium]
MKWKAACLELLDWELSHGHISDDVQELAEDVWNWDDALKIHAAYLKLKKIKGKELLTMKEANERFKKAWTARPVGNDLRTPEGRLAYMKAAEEEAQL